MTATNTASTRGAEGDLRAATKWSGLTSKGLAKMMGKSRRHLSSIASVNGLWTPPRMQDRAETVLGEVPGQGIVRRYGAWVNGEGATSGGGHKSLA